MGLQKIPIEHGWREKETRRKKTEIGAGRKREREIVLEERFAVDLYGSDDVEPRVASV